MNKRGISAVVATVLIILITVSAVVFIWVGVVPMIRDSVGDASTTFENVGGGLEIVSNKGYTVYDPDSGKISVQVKRESGDSDIARIDFVFTIDGDSVVIGRTDILSPNEIKTYIFYDLLLTEFDSSDSIKIIVVYGGDTEGILVSEVTGVKAGTVIAVNCGDGKIDAGEECEIGNLNGNDCTTVPGGYDGGTLSCYGVGSAQECLFNVSLCTSLPVCGNLNIDAGEECDGTNLGSSDCTDYGYQAGTIGCYPEGVGAECTYDISPCYNITTTNIILSNLYENMVLYLPFDSNEGTSFNEKSLNGDLMDVIGSTIYWEADGKYNGGSYYFGGGTQPDPSSYNYIETGRNYIETFSGDFSVSLWIKLPLGWESTGFPSPFGMQNNNAANPSGSINLRLRHSGVRGVIFQYYFSKTLYRFLFLF
ncbi:MAG: hypothetical protein IH845_05110 [Nanoarchaeota archaeon]|nr:hypothetical protein [Nanoarchaeota archaeon]